MVPGALVLGGWVGEGNPVRDTDGRACWKNMKAAILQRTEDYYAIATDADNPVSQIDRIENRMIAAIPVSGAFGGGQHGDHRC